MVSGLWSLLTNATSINIDENFRVVMAFAAITVVSFLIILRNIKKSHKAISPLPPGPSGLPLVGFLPFLGTQLHRQFAELSRLYGPVFKVWLGSKLCVVISSPSLAKEIVRVNDAIFANRNMTTLAKIITYGGDDIAFSPYGPEWIKLRKVFVRQVMSNASLDASFPFRKHEVNKTVKEVYSRVGEVIDVGELMFMTNMNATMRVIFGGTLDGDEGVKAGIEFRKLVIELMVLLGAPNISDFFPLLSWFDLQGRSKKVKKILKGFETFVDYTIERCLKNEPERSTVEKYFLHLLMELVDHPDASRSISATQLRAVLLDIIVGGTDTTSTMLEWIMTELLCHQESMEKVQQELDKVVGLNGVVEEHHFKELHYLDAVVKETFRLHPALPFLVPRSPSKSCTIGGYAIPKGSMVFLNVHAMHRDPQFWTDPLEFKPERFLDEKDTKLDFSGNDFQYLPFGSGRRICAGLPLAEKMLMHQLATLLHVFRWELPTDDAKLDSNDKYGIVAKKLEPLLAVPESRLPNMDLYLE